MIDTATTLPSVYALEERQRKEEQKTLRRFEAKERKRKATRRGILRWSAGMLSGSLLVLAGGFAGQRVEQSTQAGDVTTAHASGQKSELDVVKKTLLELNNTPLDQAVASVDLLMKYFSAYIPAIAAAGGESAFSTFAREITLANETLIGQGIILTSLPAIAKLFESWQTAKQPDVPPSTITQGDVGGAQTYLAGLQTFLSSPFAP